MIEAPPRFYIRPYEPWDTQDVLALLQASLGESSTLRRTEAVWRWKHLDNWFGASYVLVATSDCIPVVGLRAFMRWRLQFEDEVYEAVRAVDTATHPTFQRRGMFSQLTSKAVDLVRRHDTDLIFNTPNEKSKPGYLKLGWEEIGDVRPLVKILNRRRFAVGMLRHKLGRAPDIELDERDFLDGDSPPPVRSLLGREDSDALMEANERRHEGLIRTDGGVGYMVWRYDRHPTIRYYSTWVETDGQAEAAAIFRLNRRYGLREVVLSEFMVSRPDRGLARQLIRQLCDQVSADYLVAYAGTASPNEDLLSEVGFRRMPVAAMSLTANHISGRLNAWNQLPKWGLGLGDLEYF